MSANLSEAVFATRMSARKNLHYLAGLLLLTLSSQSFAAGTTSAAFLRLGFGARATAMGDAFTARPDDASATYWNPAGLSLLPSRELLAEHDLHVQDINVDRLAFVQPLGAAGSGPRKAIGASLTYLSLG